MKTILDLKEVSNYLKLSESMVRKMVREKTIPYFRLGYRLKFDLDEINKWIEKLSKDESKNSLYF
jgi:excisionase family DNA binding protein